MENLILDCTDSIADWAISQEGKSFYVLCSAELFADKEEGRKVLYESLEENGVEIDAYGYFHYEVESNHSIFSKNDSLIVKPTTLTTTRAFFLSGNAQSDDVLAISSNSSPLMGLSSKFFNPASSIELFEEVDSVIGSADWIAVFHTIHSDLNLCLTGSSSADLSSYLRENARIVKGPIRPVGLVNIEYENSRTTGGH